MKNRKINKRHGVGVPLGRRAHGRHGTKIMTFLLLLSFSFVIVVAAGAELLRDVV